MGSTYLSGDGQELLDSLEPMGSITMYYSFLGNETKRVVEELVQDAGVKIFRRKIEQKLEELDSIEQEQT